MNWDAVTAIAEIVGAAAVVASLLYVGLQVRQNNRQSRLAAQQATVHELGRVLHVQAQSREWAELLGKGLRDLDSLDAIEKTQFLSHLGHLLRLYELAYFQHLEGTSDPRFWSGFERAVRDVLGYPGMQAALRLRRHHLSDAFGNYLDTLASTAEGRGIFAEDETQGGSELSGRASD